MKKKKLIQQPILTKAHEKKILKSFGRASLHASWWKKFFSQIKFCERCSGSLGKRYVPAEKMKRRVCRKCGTIAYQNPKVVAATLPIWRGKVCLLRRDIEPSRGLWSYPAGYMELGETVEQAAVRETREEILCRVKITGLHGIYSYKDAGVVTLVYLAKVGSDRPRPGMEAQCVQSFLPGEIPWDELAFRSTFEALYDWVKGNTINNA